MSSGKVFLGSYISQPRCSKAVGGQQEQVESVRSKGQIQSQNLFRMEAEAEYFWIYKNKNKKIGKNRCLVFLNDLVLFCSVILSL